MEEGNLGVAGRGDRWARSPRFPRTASRPSLLGSLEAVATALAESLPLDRVAAVAAQAAATALDAPVLVIAVPNGRELRAVHVRGLPDDARHRLSAILRERRWDLESLAAVPVPLGGSRAGVMLLRRAPERRFTADEHAYLKVLTALLGLALQRARREPPAGSHLRVGDLQIDLGGQRVVVGDRHARLTPSEIRLLLYLAEEPGRPRTRREILRHLWRTEHVVDERACDAHISNLRRKIERDPSHPQRLVTVRSVGYALQPM